MVRRHKTDYEVLVRSRFASQQKPPLMSALGQEQTSPAYLAMSASLIGRLGSSTFRLPTTSVSMSLTGSRFSSDSAPGPFHHGIRRRGGTIFGATLPSR